MSYLSLLDRSSLFELLVRLHYEDLVNICKTRNFLYRITCTSHFQESWKKYNLKEITFSGHEVTATVYTSVDRLGKRHGKATVITPDGFKTEEYEYCQGKIDGIHKSWCENGAFEQTPYVNGLRHGLQITHYNQSYSKYTSYVNGVLNGLMKCCYPNGAIDLYNYKNNLKHGKIFYWDSVGTLGSIISYQNGIKHGRQIELWENGVKKKDYMMSQGELCGSFMVWNKDGTLADHEIYDKSKLYRKII